MSDYINSPSPRISVSAGTAFKIGFFGALGAFALGLIVSVVMTIIGAILIPLLGLTLGPAPWN